MRAAAAAAKAQQQAENRALLHGAMALGLVIGMCALGGPVGCMMGGAAAAGLAVNDTYEATGDPNQAFEVGAAGLVLGGLGDGAFGAADEASAEGALSSSVSFDSKQLQAKLKHASDFDVPGNYNKANRAAFQSALESSIDDPETIYLIGRYRNQPASFYFNIQSQNVVVIDPHGNFLTGWKLGPAQANNLLGRGTLGGG